MYSNFSKLSGKEADNSIRTWAKMCRDISLKKIHTVDKLTPEM